MGPSSRRTHREAFDLFVEEDLSTLPFYAALSTILGRDESAADVLDHAAPGQRRPVLLLAALQDRLFELHRHSGRPVDDLGAWYPTIVDEPRPPDPDLEAAVHSFLSEHRNALVERVATRTTQTNEANRSVAWHLGLRSATRDIPDVPVVWVELGASAGLNLAFDHFSYDLGRRNGQPVDPAEVQVGTRWRGPHRPAAGGTPPRIVSRWGADVDPVDVADPIERRWLRACIWPEQADRQRRFDAAVRCRLDHPHPLEPGDAVDVARSLPERIPAGHHVVVAHSWMLTYIPRERRSLLDEALADLGRDVPVSWLTFEGRGVVDHLPDPGAPDRFSVTRASDSLLGLSRFRNGARDDAVLARCHPHLSWTEWLSAADQPLG